MSMVDLLDLDIVGLIRSRPPARCLGGISTPSSLYKEMDAHQMSMLSGAALTAAAAAGAAALCFCSFAHPARRPLVVAVCGTSCSGKSTIASRLARELNGGDPDAAALCQDDSFDYSSFATNNCPLRAAGDGRVWKDWESPDAILWPEYIASVLAAKQAADARPVIVVEGFLLMARPASVELFDAVVSIEITKEEAWRRRRGRAQSMAHLPPGAGENTNYEVLEVYTREGDDRAAFSALADARYSDEGPLAWLRLYFEECVWPAAQAQQELVAALPRTMPVLRLDGCEPQGSEAWAAARLPQVLSFVQTLQ